METENISYIVEENTKEATTNIDLEALLDEFEQIHTPNNDADADANSDTDSDSDGTIAQVNHYEINYTLKQLCVIYDYYKLGKTSKLKKVDMIHSIVLFEASAENVAIVMKRKQLWFYLEELRADPFMKRFLWSV